MDIGLQPLEPGLSLVPEIQEHEVIRPIASGAYGEVWLSRNLVGTARAVKIVRRERHASIETFEREFKGLQKFEPLSRSHEGLVDILSLGRLPGESGFYYVMELADQAEPGPNPLNANTPNLGSSRFNSRNSTTGSKSASPNAGRYESRTLRTVLTNRGALTASEVIRNPNFARDRVFFGSWTSGFFGPMRIRPSDLVIETHCNSSVIS